MKNTLPKIYVAGHLGMVGSALCRELLARGEGNIVVRTRSQLDLTNQSDVRDFFAEEKPSAVYLAAARVGGIHANNTYPGEFIYENLTIQSNVINAAFQSGVKKLLFLGSSCAYPKHADQPMRESAILTGKFEPTNEPYAVAKIAGIKLCESYNRQYGRTHGVDYRSVMPTNLYGPGDSYHPENSHVVPALIRRFHDAKQKNMPKTTIWGTGKPRREFLYVDDMARAVIHVMNAEKSVYERLIQPMCSQINIGVGEDLTIEELARIIKSVVGYRGDIVFDTSKPDGSPRKLMDTQRIKALGWTPQISLKAGLALTYADFIRNQS